MNWSEYSGNEYVSQSLMSRATTKGLIDDWKTNNPPQSLISRAMERNDEL